MAIIIWYQYLHRASGGSNFNVFNFLLVITGKNFGWNAMDDFFFFDKLSRNIWFKKSGLRKWKLKKNKEENFALKNEKDENERRESYLYNLHLCNQR